VQNLDCSLTADPQMNATKAKLKLVEWSKSRLLPCQGKCSVKSPCVLRYKLEGTIRHPHKTKG